MSTTIDRAPRFVRSEVSPRNRPTVLRTSLLVSGIAASLFYVAANVLGALRWDGYSSVDQTISELFAVDAPSRPLVVSLLWVSGLLALAFGAGVVLSAEENRSLRMSGWFLVGIGLVDQLGPFFPMHTRDVLAAGGETYSDTMHIVLTIAISLLSLLAMGFAAAALSKGFRRYAIATMVTLVLFGALTSTMTGAMVANDPTPLMGVYERINVGAYLLWMTVVAVLLLRQNRTPNVSTASRSEARQDAGFVMGDQTPGITARESLAASGRAKSQGLRTKRPW